MCMSARLQEPIPEAQDGGYIGQDQEESGQNQNFREPVLYISELRVWV